MNPKAMPEGAQELERIKILFVVLNWGLGHATRSSVLIRELVNRGAELYIASDGDAARVLKLEFPQVTHLDLPPYDIRYGGNTILTLMGQLPRIWRAFGKEKKLIQSYHQKYRFDGVISDNRPGAYLPAIPSVYISHQLRLRAGVLGGILSWGHYQLYKNFSEVWVPDYSDQRLSRGLSNRFSDKINTRFIGPLSRIERVEKSQAIPWVAVLSGPEPSRSEWEAQLKSVRHLLPKGGLIVRGKPDELTVEEGMENYATRERMAQIYANAEVIIARTGYSTLMDLSAHGKRAILIPTPGQPEQEYLGRVIEKSNWRVSSQAGANYLSLYNEVMKTEEEESVETQIPIDLFRLFQGE